MEMNLTIQLLLPKYIKMNELIHQIPIWLANYKQNKNVYQHHSKALIDNDNNINGTYCLGLSKNNLNYKVSS